jgi:hypothetical protein
MIIAEQEHVWNDTDRVKSKYSEINLSRGQYVHLMECLRTSPGCAVIGRRLTARATATGPGSILRALAMNNLNGNLKFCRLRGA